MAKKRGIIERLIVGKPRDKDFTEADLPATRPKQFLFVYKSRFGIIFRANLLSALFFIPLMVWTVLCSVYLTSITDNMTVQEYFSNLIYICLFQYGTEIPLIMLGAVGLTGSYYIVRRLCWGQSVRLVQDFGKGLKDSWKPFLLLGLLAGIVNILLHYFFSFSLLTIAQGNVFVWGIALGAIIVVGILFIIMLMFALCQSSLYNLTFGKLIKNSMILSFKTLWRSFLVCLLSLIPVFVAVLPWFLAKIIGFALIIVFSIGFAVTVQTEFCHWVFDRYINCVSYPDFVGLGLQGGKLPEDLIDGTPKNEETEEAEDESDGDLSVETAVEDGDEQ